MMKAKLYVLDEAGEPLAMDDDVVAWGRWMYDYDYQRVVSQTPVGPYLVSTVFLGVDHQYHPDGPPLLWETMVFKNGASGTSTDGYARRYSSKAEAISGHAITVQLVALTV